MSDIVEAVAKAIWRQRVKFAAEADIDLSRDSEDDMIERNGVFEEARAAIEAYEVALIEATMNTGTGIMRKHIREGEKRDP